MSPRRRDGPRKMFPLPDTDFSQPKDRSTTGASTSNFTLSTKPIKSGQGNNGLHFRAALFLTLEVGNT